MFDYNTIDTRLWSAKLNFAVNVITYIIQEKIIKIDNQFFDLKNGIIKLNDLQKIQNNYARFDLQDFCKSAKVTNDSLKKMSKLFSLKDGLEK